MYGVTSTSGGMKNSKMSVVTPRYEGKRSDPRILRPCQSDSISQISLGLYLRIPQQ